MNHPLISVIIPLYNSEKYIEGTLLSIVGQTYENLEIIIVNDGSTDQGPAVVTELMKRDGRIKLFNQENKGQCAASNFGFAQSKGEYIKFFDADDILSPGTISTQVALLAGKDEFAVSYIDYIRFYDDDISTTNRYVLPQLINYDCSPAEYITYHGTPQMYQCGLWLFNRKLFIHTGLWDERLSLINDTEFFPRILLHVKRLYYAAGCMLYYRTNFKSGSLSQQTTLKAIRSALLSVDLMAGYIRQIEESETIEKIIALTYADVLWMSYPAHPAITSQIEKRLAIFPRSYYAGGASGKLYSIIKKLIGWKLAKRLQNVYYKMKYS